MKHLSALPGGFRLRQLTSLGVGLGLLLCCGCEDDRAMKIGEPSPVISAKDIYGGDVSLNGLKGKVVVIYFWTNSCCGNSLKELQPIYDRNKAKGLAVLAINEMDAKKAVESYAKANALTFTMLSDENNTIFKRYKGLGLPTVFILDRAGVIREKILGSIPVTMLEKLIQRQFDTAKEAKASYGQIHSPQGGTDTVTKSR